MALRVAFASCAKIQDDKKQEAWDKLGARGASLVMLLGDQVYSPWKRGAGHKKRWRKWNPAKLAQLYKRQRKVPSFKKLWSDTEVHAIWDDHDFGPNNPRGAEVRATVAWKKDRSRELFHEWMVQGDALPNHPEIYRWFEREDSRFILLDVKYHRDHRPGQETILGEDQESWFEEALLHEKKYTIICTGNALMNGGEGWGRVEGQVERFFGFVEKAQEKGKALKVLVLSGDIHENLFRSHDLGDASSKKVVHEAISSGVARNKKFFGKKRLYGMLTIDSDAVTVEFFDGDKRQSSHVIDAKTWIVEAATG